MSRLIRRIAILTVGISFSMMFGMLVGVWANTNFAEDIQFNPVQGYEANGHLGLLCVIFICLLLGSYYWVRGKNKPKSNRGN